VEEIEITITVKRDWQRSKIFSVIQKAQDQEELDFPFEVTAKTVKAKKKSDSAPELFTKLFEL
jgi:hypothetical protein